MDKMENRDKLSIADMFLKYDSRYNKCGSEVEWYINEKKKTITCVKKNVKREITNLYLRKLPEFTFLRFEAVNIPNKLIVVLKCADEDTFDVAIGKRIALKRMDAKIRKNIYKAYSNAMEVINKELNILGSVAYRYSSDIIDKVECTDPDTDVVTKINNEYDRVMKK